MLPWLFRALASADRLTHPNSHLPRSRCMSDESEGAEGTRFRRLVDTLDHAVVWEFDDTLGVYTFVLAAITMATTFVTPETRERDLTRLNDALDDAATARISQ